NTNDASILAIINISGQIIYETKITDRIRSVDLSEIATSGLYFVQIYDIDGKTTAIKKVILK
ncbi:MAG: T9SS type A sorting domain-containing protein, partial [Bacteroidales bacterium]|nr:T9SS type A sorting domain-containing protein [Bacteroidales bacterium]